MNSLVVTLERVLGNGTIAELLTTNKLLELACLALYVTYEKKQGKKSFWYPYIRELDRQRGDSLMWNLRFYENKKIKVVVIRIESPEGDALASDLMWREFKLLAKSKPIIASISDVAASGGYYMAMAAGAIVAEKLALTGSIRVITGKFNLGRLYEKIGFNKEIISTGKFAEVTAAEQRPFRC